MELIKSTKLHCFALMIYNNGYITIDKCIWWINSWLSELIIKSNYLHNYIEKLFCQTFFVLVYIKCLTLNLLQATTMKNKKSRNAKVHS